MPQYCWRLVEGGFYVPRVRLTIAAMMAVLLAGIVGCDWLARSHGLRSLVAPTVTALRQSIGFGCGYGVLVILVVCYTLFYRRADMLAFFRLPLEEQRRHSQDWNFPRFDVIRFVMMSLLQGALVVWPLCAGVFPLIPLMAAAAVAFTCNNRLVKDYQRELRAPHP